MCDFRSLCCFFCKRVKLAHRVQTETKVNVVLRASQVNRVTLETLDNRALRYNVLRVTFIVKKRTAAKVLMNKQKFRRRMCFFPRLLLILDLPLLLLVTYLMMLPSSCSSSSIDRWLKVASLLHMDSPWFT